MAFQEMVDSDIKESNEEAKKHRSSDVSAGNSLIMKTESGLTDSIEQFLPNFMNDLPFAFPTTQIFDIFQLSASKKRFQIIEKNSTMITAVYKERYSFKDLLLCCLPPEQRQKTITSAVRLYININEISCKRVVHLKGIYGFPQVILPLISDFKTRLTFALSLSSQNLNTSKYENLVNEEEETVVTCKQESSSYYQFHKILSSESYTLGKSISSFVAAFAEQYRNPEESVRILPLPLESIKETVEQAVEALFTHYNYGRANSEKIMMYCRPAVEKYIYSKVYQVLFPIYVSKTLAADQEIQRKKRALSEFESAEVYRRLGIESRLVAQSDYTEACEICERAEEFKSPIEKINCFLNAISAIKSCIIDESKGKVELSDVQDEVKLIGFVLVKSALQSPAAEIEILKDYIGYRIGAEYKEMVNLFAAVNYILNEVLV